MQLDSDYRNFLKALSEIVYDVLSWHLIMQKESVDVEKIRIGRGRIFNNIHYASVLSDEVLTLPIKRMKILDVMKQQAEDLVREYEFSIHH